jgi:hypothetical protein
VRTSITVALAALAAALLATSAFAAPTKSIPISGTFAGTASTKIDGSTATIAANGSGKLGALGAGKIVGNGTAPDTTQQPCTPFGGTGKLSVKGSVLAFTVPQSSSGCGDEGGHIFSIKGVFQVTKVTGTLAKAKGSIRFTGVYDRDGGTFSVKLTGTLKK